MALYELGMIIDPEISPEDETATLERLETMVTKGGGEVVDKDAWGWKFEAEGALIKDLNFELRTNDNVMRSLVLNLDRELRRKRKMDSIQQAKAAARAAKAEAAAVDTDSERA
jgi:ribosomal protein S6